MPHIQECILADSGPLLDFQDQGGMKSTVSGSYEDLKFKISKGCKQTETANRTEAINFKAY